MCCNSIAVEQVQMRVQLANVSSTMLLGLVWFKACQAAIYTPGTENLKPWIAWRAMQSCLN